MNLSSLLAGGITGLVISSLFFASMAIEYGRHFSVIPEPFVCHYPLNVIFAGLAGCVFILSLLTIFAVFFLMQNNKKAKGPEHGR